MTTHNNDNTTNQPAPRHGVYQNENTAAWGVYVNDDLIDWYRTKAEALGVFDAVETAVQKAPHTVRIEISLPETQGRYPDALGAWVERITEQAWKNGYTLAIEENERFGVDSPVTIHTKAYDAGFKAGREMEEKRQTHVYLTRVERAQAEIADRSTDYGQGFDDGMRTAMDVMRAVAAGKLKSRDVAAE